MLRPVNFTLSPLVLLAVLLAAAPVSFGQAAPLILSPIDESQRVVLHGNTHPQAIAANDRGPVEDSFPLNGMELLLKRSPEQEQAAAALADELQRHGSPQFHQWLTADQYAAQFGVHPQDVATISDWLRSHGFSIDNIGSNRMTIMFSGTAGQVHEAFATGIHTLEVKGQRHIANLSDPSVPAALAPVIEGIVSLNDFRPRPQIVPKPLYTFPGVNFPFYAVVPADLATIYNFNPLLERGITGQGQTIALIEDTDLYNPNDWYTFRKTFGLDLYKGGSLQTIHPGCADPGVNGFQASDNDQEAAVDVDWASAAAPGAALELAACPNTTTTFGGLIAIQNLLNQPHLPSIISLSYAQCEAGIGAAGNSVYRSTYLQGVLEGVSIFVGAGDTGAAMCDVGNDGPVEFGISVSGFASTEYNVAVGGTDFGDTFTGSNSDYWSATNSAYYGSVLSYVPEIPWNDTSLDPLLGLVS